MPFRSCFPFEKVPRVTEIKVSTSQSLCGIYDAPSAKGNQKVGFKILSKPYSFLYLGKRRVRLNSRKLLKFYV